MTQFTLQLFDFVTYLRYYYYIPQKEESQMRSLFRMLSGVISGSTTERNDFHWRWDFERNRAANFGPSHVAEIDAIFSRQ